MSEETKSWNARTSAFRELDRRSLSRDAAEQLREAIRDGSLRPGQRLPSERALAAQLGLSRPTLREAVCALVIMGLLESRHGAGTFVASATDAPGARVTIDIREDPLAALFELRLLFEPPAAARAAARVTEAELVNLAALLEALSEQVGDADSFVVSDARFHRLIHTASGSEVLLAALDSIAELALRGRTLSGGSRAVRERTIIEHGVILDALHRHDPFEAGAAMTAHLMHIRGSLIVHTD